jgi:hypothetical protein
MAEPGKARVGNSPRLNINIDSNYKSNTSNGAVDNGGSVYFNCAPTAGARVYTSPAGAFNGETNGYLTLANGNNGPYTPSVDNSVITYCCCAPTTSCTALGPMDDGGYTIQVGDPPEGDHGKK